MIFRTSLSVGFVNSLEGIAPEMSVHPFFDRQLTFLRLEFSQDQLAVRLRCLGASSTEPAISSLEVGGGMVVRGWLDGEFCFS